MIWRVFLLETVLLSSIARICRLAMYQAPLLQYVAIGQCIRHMIASHIDIQVLPAIETFVLANVTAFIAVYDFIRKIRQKKPEEITRKAKSVRRRRKAVMPRRLSYQRHASHLYHTRVRRRIRRNRRSYRANNRRKE